MRRARGSIAAVLVAACTACSSGGVAGRRAGGEPPPTATLSWEARNEQGIYGYIVYRAEQREGPFVRVSRDIVRVVDDPSTEIHAYRWVDEEVERGRTYFYYLDLVGTDGRKQKFSGVISKTVGG